MYLCDCQGFENGRLYCGSQALRPLCCFLHGSICVVLAVVFGKVVEGMALVRKAEATGTQSGKPRQPVLIADSGEVSVKRIYLSCHQLQTLLVHCPIHASTHVSFMLRMLRADRSQAWLHRQQLAHFATQILKYGAQLHTHKSPDCCIAPSASAIELLLIFVLPSLACLLTVIAFIQQVPVPG